MQYRALAVTVLAATAAAQTQGQGQSQGQDQQQAELASVISVLQTALPSSLIQEALTNSPAVSSQLASEFQAGETPGWFSSLPTAVQTYLVPAAATAKATGSIVSMGPVYSGNSTRNATHPRTTRSSTATLTSSPSSSSGNGGSNNENSSTSSTGGASLPTAIMGMGVAGVAGLVGVLAL